MTTPKSLLSTRYYLSQGDEEESLRAIATIAPGSVVVFDYVARLNLKAYRKPLGIKTESLYNNFRAEV